MRGTHTEHPDAFVQTGTASVDLAKNVIALQIPLKERQMTLLLHEELNLCKRSKQALARVEYCKVLDLLLEFRQRMFEFFPYSISSF